MVTKIKYKPKHPLPWFKVGSYVVAGEQSLFNLPILVDSAEYAKSLHANQDKGYRYQKIKP